MALRRRLSRGPGIIEDWPEEYSSIALVDGPLRYVIYARASTRRRHRQRIDRQIEDIRSFVEGYAGEVIDTFQEVGQAEDETLPERLNAINLAIDERAILIVRYVDRFSRDSNFVRGWLNQNLRLQTISHPNSSSDQLQMLAYEALERQVEHEERLREGRLRARRRGRRMGDDGSGAETRRHRAMRRAIRVMVIVKHLQRNGFHTLRAVAEELNRIGVRTPSGEGTWTHTQVARERLAESIYRDNVEGELGPVRFPPGVWQRVLPSVFVTENQGIAWVDAARANISEE